MARDPRRPQGRAKTDSINLSLENMRKEDWTPAKPVEKRQRLTKSQRRQARKNPTPAPLNPNLGGQFRPTSELPRRTPLRSSDTGRGIGGYGPGSGPMRADGSWLV